MVLKSYVALGQSLQPPRLASCNCRGGRALSPPGSPLAIAGAGEPSASRGFTLIELLIAATMMSILFLGLTSHLRGGVTVWERVTSAGEALQRQRVAVDWLERDLANAFPYKDARTDVALPALQFTHDQLSFVTLQPLASGHERAARVRYVAYECAEHDGTHGLWRTNQSLSEARAAKHEPERQLIFPRCEGFVVQYAYLSAGGQANQPKSLEWHEEWKPDPKEKIPRLLRITLRVPSSTGPEGHPLPGSTPVASVAIQRTVIIPEGTLMEFETKTEAPSPPPQEEGAPEGQIPELPEQ